MRPKNLQRALERAAFQSHLRADDKLFELGSSQAKPNRESIAPHLPAPPPQRVSLQETHENPTSPRRDQTPWWQIFLPDRGAWFFLYLLSGMLFLRPELLLWDGGSCRHILNGVMMLQNHQIPSLNYTSAIYPNIESVTRGWLSDFISGWFYQQAGLTGVVFICSLVVTLGLTWSYQMGRARGLGLASGLVMLAIVMGTVGMHWSARSHLYSYLPFLATYYFVFMSSDRSWKRPLGLAFSMMLWANLHGSFMIGPMMIGVKIGFDVFDGLKNNFLPSRKPQAEAVSETPENDPTSSGNPKFVPELRADAIAAAAILIASAINPRALSFYSHVAGYLANPEIIHKTDEWRAFDIFAGVGSWAFLILLAITTTLLVKTRTIPSKAELVFFVIMVFAGFESMRLIPYSALIAMPLLGPAWQALSSKTHGDSRLAKLIAFEGRAEEQEKSSMKVALASIAISIIMGIAMMNMPISQVKDFDAERLPVNEVNYMAEHHIDGLGFNYDNWGGYIFFKRKQKVFIDDWADFLPVQFIEDYVDVLTAKGAWQAKFNKYPFEWVLAPNESQLAQILTQDPGWKVAMRDKAGVLILRNSKRNTIPQANSNAAFDPSMKHDVTP